MQEEGLRLLFGGLSLMLDPKCSRRNITNILNRILIMLAEDCLGQPRIYVVAHGLMSSCHKKDLGTKEAIAAIVHMFGLVLGTTKGRMVSIARLIRESCSGKYTEEWCERYRGQIAVPMTSPIESITSIERFTALVKDGDLSSVTLLDQINDVPLVWKGLKLVLSQDPSVPREPSRQTIQALHNLYKMMKGEHAEKELFMYQAIVLVTFRNNVRSWTTCCRVSDRLSDQDKVLEEFKKYLSTINTEAQLSVPDYCIDMHMERARVTNADHSVVPHDLAAKYAEMYVASKTAILVERKVTPSPPTLPKAASKEDKDKVQKKKKNLLTKINKRNMKFP